MAYCRAPFLKRAHWATVGRSPLIGSFDTPPSVMDEQLPPGYFLQTSPEGGRWRLYDIRAQGECRICEINAAGDQLESQVLSGPYDAALEHWNTGVEEQLICTNRIIELLWQQQAPQAISDQLAAWHREEEALDFGALQRSAPLTFTATDGERDFREWMDALNEQRDGEVEISAEERLHGGLDDFYAQEAEMERQLGIEAEALWLDQWEVPDEPRDPEEENLELETQRWLDEDYAKWNASRGGESEPSSDQDYDEHAPEDDHYNYSDEIEPETPSYREWDDMDNFWNQEGVFEEMSDLYPLDEDY